MIGADLILTALTIYELVIITLLILLGVLRLANWLLRRPVVLEVTFWVAAFALPILHYIARKWT